VLAAIPNAFVAYPLAFMAGLLVGFVMSTRYRLVRIHDDVRIKEPSGEEVSVDS
jgi:hypothetical protein